MKEEQNFTENQLKIKKYIENKAKECGNYITITKCGDTVKSRVEFKCNLCEENSFSSQGRSLYKITNGSLEKKCNCQKIKRKKQNNSKKILKKAISLQENLILNERQLKVKYTIENKAKIAKNDIEILECGEKISDKVIFKCNLCKKLDTTANGYNLYRQCKSGVVKKCKCNHKPIIVKIYRNKKLSQDEFNERVEEITNAEYKVLGTFKNTRSNIDILHKVCDKSHGYTAKNFLYNNARCPYCAKEKIRLHLRLTHKEFVDKVKKIHGDDYKVLGKYTSSNEKIKVRHNICGHTWEPIANDLLSGSGCNKCSNNQLKTQKEFEKEVLDVFKGEYIVLGKYINSNTPIEIMHINCGTSWDTSTPASLIRNQIRCPKCYTKSKAEKKAKEILKKYNIKYISEMKFKDCIYKRELPFDIYLPDFNTLIEIQGSFHRTIIKRYNNNLELQKHKDFIKKDYASKNSFNFYAVDYLDEKYPVEKALSLFEDSFNDILKEIILGKDTKFGV